MKLKLLYILSLLPLIPNANAQDISIDLPKSKRNSISLHMGEPSSISYSRELFPKSNFWFRGGFGILEHFYVPDYEAMYYNGFSLFYQSHKMVYTLNLSLCKKIALSKDKFGFQFNGGFQHRLILNLLLSEYQFPRNKLEPFLFFQPGVYFKPGIAPFEFGVNWGWCMKINQGTSYFGPLGDLYIGVQF
jgi:hypothetical protein